jgi:hypothetical protein
MKTLLFFAISITAHAFDVTQVDWSEVKSQVRWINLTTESKLLTLSIDNFEALKKLKSGSEFPPTKFPPGQFQATISDYQKNNLETFPLKISNSSRYTLATLGIKPNFFTLIIEELKPSQKGFSKVHIFNACPDSSIEWKPWLDQEPLQINFGKSTEIEFPTEKPPYTFFSIQGKNIQKIDLKLNITHQEDSNCLVFVHLDEIDRTTPKLILITENSSEL